MKYRNIIISLGFLIIIMQSLGFPQSVRDVLYIVSGSLIVALGYLSGKEKRTKPSETGSATSIQS